jgi:hypothetical protein
MMEKDENKEVELEQNEEIQEYNTEEMVQADQDFPPPYEYETYVSSYV